MNRVDFLLAHGAVGLGVGREWIVRGRSNQMSSVLDCRSWKKSRIVRIPQLEAFEDK